MFGPFAAPPAYPQAAAAKRLCASNKKHTTPGQGDAMGGDSPTAAAGIVDHAAMAREAAAAAAGPHS